MIGREQSEDSQLTGPVIIFNKTIEENFPNLKNEMPINIQEAYTTPNRLDQKRNFSQQIIIRTTMKSLDRCNTDTKRTQMPAQATIPSQTLNYHRWRTQSIP